ncbi:unnamed protein product [Taenia asiatica]|uniref:Borealin N-terminal domain-containing protein n=1 Tax=Taenia asiatica TaxID=60517 RepID=A0A0R3W5N4_TAEAS|nr:unnamed protein product [Taenia asiatica]
MPQILEPTMTNYGGTDLEPHVLRSLFDEASSEFKRRVSAKRAIFGRYLDTRVNWLRLQLMREAEATNSLSMNHLDFLRTYKPDWVPEANIAYRLVESEGKSQRMRQPPRIPPTSAMRVINTVRRAAARSRLKQSRHYVLCLRPLQVTSTPCPASTNAPTKTATVLAGAPRTQSNRSLHLTKATAEERKGCTTKPRQGRPRRAAAIAAAAKSKLSSALLNQSSIPKKTPTISIFDRESILYALSGSPVVNPFAHLSNEAVRKIKRIINEEQS